VISGKGKKMKLSNVFKTLEGQPVFSGLTQDEFNVIFELSEIKNYPKDEYIFHESMPRTAMYVILEGKLQILQGIGDKISPKAIYQQGALISERILRNDHSPHGASAQALTELSVLEISRQALHIMRNEHLALYEKLVANAYHSFAEHMKFSGLQNQHARSDKFRIEHDLLGERQVPADVLYGVQTLRGLENFPITAETIGNYPSLIKGLAMVKKAAAMANYDLKLLKEDITKAIIQACDEIITGNWHEHFVVDVMQGGAGTSTNMNANEVIANRALIILGKEPGDYDTIHPNNHINLSQSTNDVYPTALRVALRLGMQRLIGAMSQLAKAFEKKSREFDKVIKMGRTQLQDAVPMTLGQEFSAYALMVEEDIARVRELDALLKEINMGATAIGTGLNANPQYTRLVRQHLEEITGMEMITSHNLVEATQDTGAYVFVSATLKRFAVKVSKICNDLRLLSSGPRAGLNEINLPAVQPGSSIMPGKVNPVIPEVVNQVAFEVIGNDVTITIAAEAGQLQLNVMEPVIAWSLFKSINHLRQACIVLAERTVKGITANTDIARSYVERSIGLVTALLPALGYGKASEVAKEALINNRSIREVVLEKGLLTAEELDQYLSIEKMANLP
jgi:aspartate ammonia-lyase